MLAVAGRPPDRADFAVEWKWDGQRILAAVDAGTCRLYSRTRQEVSRQYPEIVAAVRDQAQGQSLLLDGEIVAPDQAAGGAPSFARLQRRMHLRAPSVTVCTEVPVEYFLFDLLGESGQLITSWPYLERREQLLELRLTRPPIRTPPHWIGVEAQRFLEVGRAHAIEGIVSKRVDSQYLPGRRSPAWVKTTIRIRREFVIVGWLSSRRAQDVFGSLVLAGYDSSGSLLFSGVVGSGFDAVVHRMLQPLLERLAVPGCPLDVPPPGEIGVAAHWVEPILVCETEFREAGRTGLRHPSWKGLRTDKEPREVTHPLADPR